MLYFRGYLGSGVFEKGGSVWNWNRDGDDMYRCGDGRVGWSIRMMGFVVLRLHAKDGGWLRHWRGEGFVKFWLGWNE